MARLTLARKIATIVLIVWKRGVEGPKHLRNRAALVDELVNHILKVFLALPPSEKFFPYPSTEESGYRGSKFFIGHDFVLPRSLPWGCIQHPLRQFLLDHDA